MDPENADMWLQVADVVEAAEADRNGNVAIHQDELAAHLGVDVSTLIKLLDELHPAFSILYFNDLRVHLSKSFVWMLRALANPQPEDRRLTDVEARRRVAKSGAEFMDAGQEFDDRTLARVTGVPHFHVERIIRELNYEVDSNVEASSGGFYGWKGGDADRWKTEAFPLAEADDPLVVFNIERTETTLVHGDQYNVVNNITYAQVFESLTQIIEAAENLDGPAKRSMVEKLRSFVTTAAPFVDLAVKFGELFGKAG